MNNKFSKGLLHLCAKLMVIIGFMEWIIERVSSNEESVFLVKPATGTHRRISVPGAIDALLQNGKLVIQASTGFLWEVDPDTGSRKRISGQPAM